MKMRIKLVPIVLGFLVVLGIPPVLLLTALSPSEEIAAVDTPKNPLHALIAQDAGPEQFYLGWQKGYLARGGDRNVLIPVAWTDALSTERSQARGQVHLNMIDGVIRAEVRGLDGPPADLWLVDNQEGPGMTVQPQPGDRMVRVGRLRTAGGAATVAAQLGPRFFHDFELDLVVVSRAGRTPAESSILLGTRDFFDRLYTQTRVAREKARARNARMFGPAALLSLLSPRSAEANSTQILISHGLVSSAVGQGGDLFFTGLFGGNGRTCATCHRVENNQGLDLDFISTLPASDKLFVAEQAGGVPGLERPLLMRGHALILENVDGLENPTQKFTMRGVPHSLSLATSILAPQDNRGPVQRTGWSGDGAPGTGALRLFPNGAVKQHFTKSLNRTSTDFTLPTDTQLDNMQAFMLASGRTNELDLANVTLTNAGAQAGKLRFVQADARCNACHGNAGANVTFTPGRENFNFNTGVERAPDPSQATEPHPHDGGFGAAVVPNFDCDGNGSLDCFGDGTFNTPPLIEAADTEPFFHNNNFATIEDATRFFTTQAFAQSPAGGGNPIPLSEADIQNIGAFLRVLNAAFNAAISIQRNTAARQLENSSDSGNGDSILGGPGTNGKRETVNMLLALSNVEARDAIKVLSDRGLHADAVTLFNSAISKNDQAINETSSNLRASLIQGALSDLNAAKAKFGTGLTFTMGAGNLMFPPVSGGGGETM